MKIKLIDVKTSTYIDSDVKNNDKNCSKSRVVDHAKI